MFATNVHRSFSVCKLEQPPVELTAADGFWQLGECHWSNQPAAHHVRMAGERGWTLPGLHSIVGSRQTPDQEKS
jgi:hypothetical protein